MINTALKDENMRILYVPFLAGISRDIFAHAYVKMGYLLTRAMKCTSGMHYINVVNAAHSKEVENVRRVIKIPRLFLARILRASTADNWLSVFFICMASNCSSEIMLKIDYTYYRSKNVLI